MINCLVCGQEYDDIHEMFLCCSNVIRVCNEYCPKCSMDDFGRRCGGIDILRLIILGDDVYLCDDTSMEADLIELSDEDLKQVNSLISGHRRRQGTFTNEEIPTSEEIVNNITKFNDVFNDIKDSDWVDKMYCTISKNRVKNVTDDIYEFKKHYLCDWNNNDPS